MSFTDSRSHGGFKEMYPIINDPQCVPAQWESFLKTSLSATIHRVFLMLQSPAGRTCFWAGDKWMFLGNAISSPVCVPVFQWPPQAQNTSLLVHPAPSPALTVPLPAVSSSQSTYNLLLFLPFLKRRSLCYSLILFSPKT